MLQFLFTLLQATNYSKPKSGGEAILIGLITGAIIYGVSAAFRSSKKDKS